jgi:septum formation protein
MFAATLPLILASASPRRQHFLRQLGLEFCIEPAVIDETPVSGEAPDAFVQRMALTKAQTVADLHPQACVIGADTVVFLGPTLFGKPNDQAEALAILSRLQGQTHGVITAVAVLCASRAVNEIITETTRVTFDHFPTTILQAYVESGEPMDKAGAYGIQGKGTFLVRSIVGSYSNVVGLPVNGLVRILLDHHLIHIAPQPGR